MCPRTMVHVQLRNQLILLKKLFPVSHFTSHTTAQLPSLSSICASFHALGGTCPIPLDQTPLKEFQSFLQRIFSAAT